MATNDKCPLRMSTSIITNFARDAQLAFIKRLDSSWIELAILLGIESWEQATFEKGHEASAIWKWLEVRNRLDELPVKLTEIDRADLAKEFQSDFAALDSGRAAQLTINNHALREFYQKSISRWSAPQYELDNRFVDLTLLIDQGKDQQGQRWQQQDEKFQSLAEIVSLTKEPLVLLGAPGSGKSSLLQHYELERAHAGLAEIEQSNCVQPLLTFFVQLNDYKSARKEEPLPLPLAWLAARWAQQNPRLPGLQELLVEGRMILLLDALNEMPNSNAEKIELWKDFLAYLESLNSASRVIFSCRFLDYGSQLSVKDRTVIQVRIEALSDQKVRAFLINYKADEGEKLWDKLKDTAQLDVFRTPYYLYMLISESEDGNIPSGRAALFTRFVWRLLKRELNNSLFQAGELLHPRDIERLRDATQGKTPYELPQRGPCMPKLAWLAFSMQKQSNSTESGLVKIDYDQALAILGQPFSEKIIQAGEAIHVLEEDRGQDQVFYVHQLLQEYFAAQYYAQAPEPKLAEQAWLATEVTPNLVSILADLPDSDPLPPLASTGWEETLLLAAAMSANADNFIRQLMAENLALAGRCAAQADVHISAHCKTALQQALIERSQHPQADLRARIAAGLALGELGDPRFHSGQGPDGWYLLPPLLIIPGGVYRIGSDEGLYEDESPEHSVTLEAFQCSQFPVTNAEWRCFMQAGGYQDERWWITADAKAWRRGENTDAGPKQQQQENRKYFQDNFSAIRQWLAQGQITSKQADDWETIAQWSDEEFAAWLNENFPGGLLAEPAYWHDEAFNQPAKPVVGICWYEAKAYCAWLSAQSGRNFRLATEAEWEAAAGGLKKRRFAYGEQFDSSRANTFESHIRTTTPIGIYADHTQPDVLQDMTGNVWEWTSSAFLAYPYSSEDGRENLENSDYRRVVRGGSWRDLQDDARVACRDHRHPGGRYLNLGFRVVCSSPIT